MPRRLPAKPSSPLPSALSPGQARDRLLRAAGVDEAQQAADLREALSAVRDALSAASPINPVAPDHYARLQAAKFIRDLYGAAPSKADVTSGPGQVLVNIQLPEWAGPAPAKARVIDVEANPA